MYYGRDYTLEELTVSATADRLGLSNMPATAAHRSNLDLLEDFLNSIPFDFTVTSVYRSPAVNEAVGGSSSSQHMNGLAVDLSPIGLNNEQLATWFWVNRADYPELDQVIWYRNTTHVHIGICPAGAQGCVSGAPRGRFYVANSESSSYERWLPDDASMRQVLAMYEQTRPRLFMGAKILALTLGVAGVVGLGVLLWRWRNR